MSHCYKDYYSRKFFLSPPNCLLAYLSLDGSLDVFFPFHFSTKRKKNLDNILLPPEQSSCKSNMREENNPARRLDDSGAGLFFFRFIPVGPRAPVLELSLQFGGGKMKKN